MRRVGLVDITVGNATRLGASQRSTTRRCASHHIATQRLSRWGSPAARARLARTVPLNDASVDHGKPNPAIVPRHKLNKAYRVVRGRSPALMRTTLPKTEADRFMKCPGFGANAR
jgi:hypothetical protein